MTAYGSTTPEYGPSTGKENWNEDDCNLGKQVDTDVGPDCLGAIAIESHRRRLCSRRFS